MSPKEIEAQAFKEIAEEKFRQAVDVRKEQLRKHRTLWERLFPWKITIERKN